MVSEAEQLVLSLPKEMGRDHVQPDIGGVQPPLRPAGLPAGQAGTLAALAQLNAGRVLRPLVNFTTAVSFYFHLRQFLSAGFVVRYNPDIAYITILAAYAGHREVRRWVKDPDVIAERARRGELFVVGWWAFYYVTLVAANHVAFYQIPEGLLALCLQVTAVFFGTLTSQQVYKGRTARGGEPNDTLENRIMEYLQKASEPVKSSQLQEQFGASKATIWRATEKLQAQGKVEWTGKNPTDPEGGFRVKVLKELFHRELVQKTMKQA